MTHITIETMAKRWTSLERPLFKGKLIDSEGCKCAQGDVLFCAGYTDKQLRVMAQSKADKETARVLGISITHAVLLRHVNDSVGGAPQFVLTNPEEVLGQQAPLLLAFWLYLDNLSDAAWDAARARDAAKAAAWYADWYAAVSEAAGTSAGAGAARDAAKAASRAAAWASTEIQGIDILEHDGKQPYFLAFFGLNTWDKVRALVSTIDQFQLVGV